MNITDGSNYGMAYQLSDLITNIKLRAKDDSFSDTLITDFLNATQAEVLGHRRFRFMEVSDTDRLASGQSEFDLADDVSIIDYMALEVDSQDYPLTYVAYRDFFDGFTGTATGQPTSFTIHANTVYVNTTADQSYTVNYKYLKKPTPMDDDADTPDIPEDFKELLIRGALAGIEEYRENFDIAGLHRRKVEELAEDMNLRYGLRQLIRAPKQTRRSFRRAAL